MDKNIKSKTIQLAENYKNLIVEYGSMIDGVKDKLSASSCNEISFESISELSIHIIVISNYRCHRLNFSIISQHF